MKAAMVVIVIHPQRTTVRVLDDNSRGISEIYARTRDGHPDYIEGNFEDEPELAAGLVEVLGDLQAPVLEVMKQLQQQE